MADKRCRAEGGPANCRAKHCPERDAMQILLRTEHGSTLYGLAHEHSDSDTYVVVQTKKGARRRNISQRIDGEADVTKVDFDTFVQLVEEGVPQALEALYSTQTDIDEISAFRKRYFANSPNMVDKYLRTIINFALNTRHMPSTIKTRRHAARLVLNLNEMLETGQFNPTLNAENVAFVKRVAELPWKEYRAELDACSRIAIPWKDGADDEALVHEQIVNEKNAARQDVSDAGDDSKKEKN